MKKLLLGYDGSEAAREAARAAARVAARFQSKVTVLTVGHFVSTLGTLVVPTVDESAFLPTAEEGAELVRSLGVDADAEVLFGGPGQMLVELAARQGFDMVVVGHRGLGGIQGLLLGSVAKRVATDATCPVLVARGRAPEGIRRVLVALDGSEHAERAFETAAVLAKGFGAEIALVHVVDSRALQATTEGATMSQLQRTLIRTGEGALAEASAICDRLAIACRVNQAQGDPAQAIVELAKNSACDLVAVGRRGAGGLSRLVLGSVSDHVLSNAGPLVLLCGEHAAALKDAGH